MLLGICNYDHFLNDFGPVLRIITRNEQQERIILDIQDEKLMPHFSLLKRNYSMFMEVIAEKNLEKYIVKTCDGLEDENGEGTFEVYCKFPYYVRLIRDGIQGLRTYQADVKWEKMVFQKMKWAAFIEVDDDKYSEWGFTPLDAIHRTDKIFNINFNICYWDIETNSSFAPGKQWADCRFAHKIPIISYSVLNKYKKEIVYYGCMDGWKNEIIYDVHHTQLGKKALDMPKFADYPKEFPLTIKKFGDEALMHKTFIDDFSRDDYDGLMTFNGRGGNRINKGRRRWYNGFDLPIFFERCIYLGLGNHIQKLSSVNFVIKGARLIQESVKRRIRKNMYGSETGREYEIKCVPQHDLLYDDNVLFYTKNEHEMKRHGLEDYLRHFLGIGKVEHEGLMVWELMDLDWEKEMRYNNVDVEGLYALDLYFGYTTDVALRALAYGGKVEDGVYASKLHDHIKLWFTSDKYVLPTREYHSISNRANQWQGFLKGKYGGYNAPVKRGLYGFHKVQIGAIFDFSKLYPSCSRSVNADTRTKINLDHYLYKDNRLYLVDKRGREYAYSDCARSPAGYFTKEFKAIDSIIYDELIELRNKYDQSKAKYAELETQATAEKEKRIYKNLYNTYHAIQFSYKGLINGKYGADGMEGTRSFDLVVYNTPPSMGQILIKKVMELLKEYGYETILASTDSAMTILNSTEAMAGWDEAQEITRKINEELAVFVKREFNIIKNYIHLGCEKVFDLAIIFDKRRYMLNTVIKEEAGKVIVMKKPKAYYRGMEYVRRDTAKITHDVQENLMNMIRLRVPQEKIFAYVKKVDEQFERTASKKPKGVKPEVWTTYPWSYICGRSGISMAIEEGSGQKYMACRNANIIMGKKYDAGANPLLGIFKKHPLEHNGCYVEPGTLAMAFDDVDEYPLKKSYFDLDYGKIKQTHLIDKVEPILQLCFNTSYKDAIADFGNLFDY